MNLYSRKISTLGHIFRVVLVIICLFGIYFFYLMHTNEKSLDNWGTGLINVYEGYYEHRWAGVKHRFKKNNSEALSDLLELKEDLDDLKPRDRLYSIKKSLSLLLIAYYQSENNIKPAMELLDGLIRESGRDINLRRKRIDLQYQFIDKTKALNDLSDLWRQFPERSSISQHYYSLLVDSLEYQKAFKVLNRVISYYEKFPLVHAEILRINWKGREKKFRTKKSKQVPIQFLPERLIVVEFELPKHTSAIRIHFLSELTLAQPILNVRSKEYSESIKLWHGNRELKRMSIKGEMLTVTSPKKPNIVIQLDKRLSRSALQLELKARYFKEEIPFWVRNAIGKTKETSELSSLLEFCPKCRYYMNAAANTAIPQ